MPQKKAEQHHEETHRKLPQYSSHLVLPAKGAHPQRLCRHASSSRGEHGNPAPRHK